MIHPWYSATVQHNTSVFDAGTLVYVRKGANDDWYVFDGNKRFDVISDAEAREKLATHRINGTPKRAPEGTEECYMALFADCKPETLPDPYFGPYIPQYDVTERPAPKYYPPRLGVNPKHNAWGWE